MFQADAQRGCGLGLTCQRIPSGSQTQHSTPGACPSVVPALHQSALCNGASGLHSFAQLTADWDLAGCCALNAISRACVQEVARVPSQGCCLVWLELLGGGI